MVGMQESFKSDDNEFAETNSEIATEARNEFLWAWEETHNKHNPCFDSRKWDVYGDALAHLNHVAEDDHRGQELEPKLIKSLRDEAAKMNQMASAKVAPLKELDLLLARAH